jgi:type I restriction enzyme S subunit
MAGEWKRTSLREAGVTLIDCDHRTPPAADSGYPYVAIPQLKEGRLSLGDVRRISPEHFAEWTRKAKPQHHDVILSRRCNPGETAYVPSGLECALGQNLVLLRADGKKLFPPFLRWLVRGTDWWEQVGTFINVGAVFDSLRCADIPNFSMPLPPLAEQKAIAAVLGALDEKIELNRRMNATLEAMARVLFQSWFVDFDPVRRNKDEGGRMKDEISALFPDSFQESPLGLIPKGWEIMTLSELTTLITKGTTPTQSDMTEAPDTDASINYVRVNSIEEDGSILASKLTKIPASVHAGVLKRSVLFANDALYTIAGTIGRIALAEDWMLPANTNQAVAIIRPESDIPSGFIVLTMQHDEFRKELHNNIVQAVQANLSLGMLSKARVVVPPRFYLPQIFAPIGALLSQISANRAQSRTLATLRDTLLPKLLSGELSVADIKKNLP